MGNLKKNKSVVKEAVLLSVISKYHFLVIGLLVQIFLLLLVSLAAELYPILAIEHNHLINLVSIVTAAVCILVHALRWSHPMCNEIPIIAVTIWFLLSTQSSLYCICCHPSHGHHGHFIMSLQNQADNNTNLAEIEDWSHEMDDYVPCKEEDFRYIYSLFGIGLFVASFFNDIRNYYLSALNRVITLCTFFVLLLLLIISPLSSTQFSVNQTLLIIVRITVYHTLWFITQYKTITELVLIHHYKDTIKKAKHSPLLYKEKGGGGGKKVGDGGGDGPVGMLMQIDQITDSIRKHRSTNAVVIGSANDVNSQRRALFNRYIEKMSEINHTCYAGAWVTSMFSWKNRHASINTQKLFDIIQILWVLVVPPFWLLLLSPITFFWLLCQIYANTNELPHTLKTTRILDVIHPSS